MEYITRHSIHFPIWERDSTFPHVSPLWSALLSWVKKTYSLPPIVQHCSNYERSHFPLHFSPMFSIIPTTKEPTFHHVSHVPLMFPSDNPHWKEHTFPPMFNIINLWRKCLYGFHRSIVHAKASNKKQSQERTWNKTKTKKLKWP